MSLHGRQAETAAIDAVLQGDGFGQLVLIGEAGLGKTALVGLAAEYAAERGMLVLRGRAAVHERSVPFGLVIDALDEQAARMIGPRLAAAGPELAAVLPSAAGEARGAPVDAPGPGERFRYHRALRAFVEILGRETPVALLLDDVQWADEASLEWILHLARRPPEAPGALFVSMRASEASTLVLEALGGSGEQIVLEPLGDEAAAATLAEVDPPLRARIIEEARGNPLFLLELARAAQRSDAALPATIAAAVAREVTDLAPDRRRMLEGAAVAGDPFDPQLASAAAGLTGDAGLDLLDELARVGLIRPRSGATFAFRHPLVRRAVYDGAPPGWRVRAHERAARVLAERGAPASLRAYHVERFAQPGDGDAVAVLESAALEDAQCSPATAAHWYEAALRLDSGQTRLLAPLGDALAAAGRLGDALRAYDRALTVAPDPDVVVRAANVERLLGHNSDARRRLVAALEQSGPQVRPDLELELAAATFALGEYEEAAQRLRTMAAQTADDDPATIAMTEALDAFAGLWSQQPDRALLERAERRVLGLPDSARFEPVYWVGTMSFMWERYAQASAILGRAVAKARAARREHGLPQLQGTLSLSLLFDLQPQAALEAAEASEDGARLQNTLLQAALGANARALALELLGSPADAVAAARTSQDLLDREERSVFTQIATILNLTVIHASDPEHYLAEVTPLFGDGIIERPTSVLRMLVDAALATGRHDEAARFVARFEAGLDHTGRLPAATVRVMCARAAIQTEAEPEEAVETARAAVALGETELVRTDTLRARIALGRALEAAGMRDEAVEQLERVIVDANAGGAQQLASEAARELRRSGARPSAAARRSAATGEELSERERSIAELVAAGRSNKEVAAALFVSPKTVENNLSRIYAKLGVRSRTELALALRERQPLD
jgi:DNA-binding NarL/FixJ family response regulator